jgi:hypothetical protein
VANSVGHVQAFTQQAPVMPEPKACCKPGAKGARSAVQQGKPRRYAKPMRL